MTRVRSIVFECSGYRGAESHERRKAVEEYVMGCIEGECKIESVTMREACVAGDAVQPTVEVMYSRGDYRRLIPLVDGALQDIGLVASKALVSTVAPHVAGMVAAGVGVGGGLAGVAAGRRRRGGGPETAAAVLAGTLIGAAVGALAGKAAEGRTLGFIGTKQSDKWHIKRFPPASR